MPLRKSPVWTRMAAAVLAVRTTTAQLGALVGSTGATAVGLEAALAIARAPVWRARVGTVWELGHREVATSVGAEAVL